MDSSALLLCQNMSTIINYDFPKLKELQSKLSPSSKPYQIITSILTAIDNNVDVEVNDDVKSKV